MQENSMKKLIEKTLLKLKRYY